MVSLINMKMRKVFIINLILDDYSKKYTNNENNKVEDLRKRKRLIL